jgi:hypothetical protein
MYYVWYYAGVTGDVPQVCYMYYKMVEGPVELAAKTRSTNPDQRQSSILKRFNKIKMETAIPSKPTSQRPKHGFTEEFCAN